MGIQFLHPMGSSEHTLAMSGVVDADILSANWRVLFSYVNGGLDGSSLRSDFTLNENRLFTYRALVSGALNPDTGSGHNHDGVSSAPLGVKSIGRVQLGYTGWGMFMGVSTTLRTILYFGSCLLASTLTQQRLRAPIAYDSTKFGVALNAKTVGFVSEVYPDGENDTEADLLMMKYPVFEKAAASFPWLAYGLSINSSDAVSPDKPWARENIQAQWLVVGCV